MPDGPAVGTTEGLAVGGADGAAVAFPLIVGEAVGTDVGDHVVGIADGTDDGTEEGGAVHVTFSYSFSNKPAPETVIEPLPDTLPGESMDITPLL